MKPPREPMFNVPGAVLGLLVLLVGLHAVREAIPTGLDQRVVATLAFVPIRLTALFDPQGVAQRLTDWAAANDLASPPSAELTGQLLRQIALPAIPTLLTYALLHGGWAHVGLNAIWLLAFGTPVARRFGPVRFLAFAVAAALAGSLTHELLFPFSPEPLVGASAAVSGCMGAALRFAFRDRTEVDAGGGTAASLIETMRNRRAVSFLLAWFVSNALFGIGSVSFGLSDQPVAWQAHIGGFLTGLLLFRWFDPKPLAPVELPDAPSNVETPRAPPGSGSH